MWELKYELKPSVDFGVENDALGTLVVTETNDCSQTQRGAWNITATWDLGHY